MAVLCADVTLLRSLEALAASDAEITWELRQYENPGAELHQILQRKPTVLLVNGTRCRDCRAPCAEKVHARSPSTPILVARLRPQSQELLAELASGVRGEVIASAPRADLRHALVDLSGGGYAFSRQTVWELFDLVNSALGGVMLRELTPTERKILPHLLTGLTAGEIAINSRSATETVRVHVKSILRKLRVPKRDQVGDFIYRRIRELTQK